MTEFRLCFCALGRTGRSLWQINRFDFVVWIVTYICTTFVSITIGLVVGVGLSCLLAIVQAQRVRGGRLTRAADTEIYYYCRPSTTTATTCTCSVTMPVGVLVYRSSIIQFMMLSAVILHQAFSYLPGLKSVTVPFTKYQILLFGDVHTCVCNARFPPFRCRSSVAVSPFCRYKIPLFCKNYVRKSRSVTAVNSKKIRN